MALPEVPIGPANPVRHNLDEYVIRANVRVFPVVPDLERLIESLENCSTHRISD